MVVSCEVESFEVKRAKVRARITDAFYQLLEADAG